MKKLAFLKNSVRVTNMNITSSIGNYMNRVLDRLSETNSDIVKTEKGWQFRFEYHHGFFEGEYLVKCAGFVGNSIGPKKFDYSDHSHQTWVDARKEWLNEIELWFTDHKNAI